MASDMAMYSGSVDGRVMVVCFFDVQPAVLVVQYIHLVIRIFAHCHGSIDSSIFHPLKQSHGSDTLLH